MAGPQILYIAGTARSGSTIVENLIGQAEDVCSIGELRSLWKQGLIDGGLCGCGERLDRCTFWRGVIAEAFGGRPPAPETVFDLQVRHSRIRPRKLLALGTPCLGVPAGLRRYIELIAAIYKAAAVISGSGTIVDASKTPIELLGLLQLTDMDIKIIHLVRDPRGVAYSVSRIKGAPDRPFQGVMRTAAPLTSAARWSAAHATLLYQVRRLAGPSYMLCRYEDFASAPSSVLAAIGRLAGLSRGIPPVTAGEEVAMKPTHGAGGNPDRLRRQTAVIQPDEEWRTHMSRVDRLSSTLPTLPLLHEFDYPLWI